MTSPNSELRWFQFRLRTLLVFVTLCAILCSWLAVKKQQAKREREAAAAIEKLGADVSWSKSSGPAWLWRLLGDDLFVHVESLDLNPPGVGHAHKPSRSTFLERFDIITDATLENLEKMRDLEILQLCRTNMTDSALEHLKGLNRLQELELFGTNVTDAGLEHLKGLTRLERLNVEETKVTDEGVKKLQQALPNCSVEWTNSEGRVFY